MQLSYKTNPYATHQPVLLEIARNTTGNILELGCGDGSTELFRNFINKDRTLYSLESNKEWYDKYKHLENDYHKLLYVNASNDNVDSTGEVWTSYIKSTLKDIQFDIVFIDQSPWIARKHCLQYFMNKAKYIVVHDVDYFVSSKEFGKITNDLSSGGKQKYEFDFSDIAKMFYTFYPPFEYYTYPTGIPTLVCSNLASDSEFTSITDVIKKNYLSYY